MSKNVLLFTADALLLDANNNWWWPWGRGSDQPMIAPGGEDAGVAIIFPVPGIVRNMYVRARTAPTGAGNMTYRPRKNGVDEAMNVVIAQAAAPHAGSDLVNSFSIVPGDFFGMRGQGSVAPLTAGADFACSYEFETAPRTRFLHWGFGNNLPVRVNNGIFGYGSAPDRSVGVTAQYPVWIPRKGYLKNFYVRNGTNFGATSRYLYSIWVNGVNVAPSLISIPLAYGSNIANETTTAIPVAAGDYVECTCEVLDALSGTDRMSASMGYYY